MNLDSHLKRATEPGPVHGRQGPDDGIAGEPAMTAAAIARQIDDLARALNHATRATGGPRLEFAADVYEVLGSLSAALDKLPQACGQLVDFLARHESVGALRGERGFPHTGRPGLAVEIATLNLGQAAVAANVAAGALGRAQEAISGLSHLGPGKSAEQRLRPTLRPQSTDHGAPDREQAMDR